MITSTAINTQLKKTRPEVLLLILFFPLNQINSALNSLILLGALQVFHLIMLLNRCPLND